MLILLAQVKLWSNYNFWKFVEGNFCNDISFITFLTFVWDVMQNIRGAKRKVYFVTNNVYI